MPGTMRYGATPRWYSIDGIMPTSIAPSCSSVAHFDGASNRSAKRSGSPLETVDEGARVQVIDRAQANDGHQAQQPEAPIPLDRLERRRADVALDLLDRAAPRAEHARIDGGDPVDVVGAHGQRDLRQLRSVDRPVDLNRIDVGHDHARERDLLHVVVAGRRLGDGHGSRQRRERAKPADRRLEIPRALDGGNSRAVRQLARPSAATRPAPRRARHARRSPAGRASGRSASRRSPRARRRAAGCRAPPARRDPARAPADRPARIRSPARRRPAPRSP